LARLVALTAEKLPYLILRTLNTKSAGRLKVGSHPSTVNSGPNLFFRTVAHTHKKSFSSLLPDFIGPPFEQLD